MSDIMGLIMQQLGGGALSQISQQIGADEGTTQNAVSAAVPLLLSALSRNAAQPGGAEAIHQAVAEDHDGSILDDLGGFLSNPQVANGAGILGHVLGGQRETVESGLAQGTGLNLASVGPLMEILAPMVMGALGRTQRQQGLDVSGLANLLGNQQNAAQQTPGMMGFISQLLDSNHDGSMVDDVLRIAGGLFRRG